MTGTTERITAVAPPSPPRRRPMSRRLVLAVAGAVLLAVVAVWVVAFSPVLGVRTVDVRGTRTLTAAEVRAAAQVKSGAPLIRLDTGAIARRVEHLAAVKTVSVHTSYPGTVTIDVVERVAVGYLESSGSFTLVDASGVQFRTVSARPARLPLFVVPSGSGPNSVAAAQAVATVAGDLPGSLRAQVASVQALDPNAITLLLNDHRVVQWGGVGRSAEKAQLLPTLLRQPGTQFNVANPDQVIAR